MEGETDKSPQFTVFTAHQTTSVAKKNIFFRPLLVNFISLYCLFGWSWKALISSLSRIAVNVSLTDRSWNGPVCPLVSCHGAFLDVLHIDTVRRSSVWGL